MISPFGGFIFGGGLAAPVAPTVAISGNTATLTHPDATAKIYYTTDGSTPTGASTLYTAPITLNGGTTTVKAIAYVAPASAPGSATATITDPDAAAYFSAVTTAGGTLTTAQQTEINTFIGTAKNQGFWANLLDGGVLCGNGLTAALVKFKTYTGSGTSLTNEGFVSGDYAPTTGLTANGSKGVKNGFPWNSYGTNILGLSFFENDEQIPTATNNVYMGRDTAYGAPYAVLGAAVAGRTVTQGGYTGTVSLFLTTSPQQYGLGRSLTHLVRSSNSLATLYVNGVKVATNTTAMTDGVPASNVPSVIFAGGSSGYHGFTGVGSFYAIDDGQMGDAKAALFAAAVLKLQQGLGRFVPASYPLRMTAILGQSNGTAANGSPALSTSQPYLNRCFPSYNPGDQPSTKSKPVTLVPFVETTTETMASGAANLTSSLWRADHSGDASRDVVIGNYATGGYSYAYIKKGGTGTNYANSIAEITAANAISTRYGTGLLVPYLWMVHGETDENSTTYAADITQQQVDYQTDIQAITGQTGTIPILHSQPSAWTYTSGVTPYISTALSHIAILNAYRANPTKVILTCPKYMFPYGTGGNGVHLTNAGLRWLGEYYGKVSDRLNRGQTWTPLLPLSVTRSGATITVVMSRGGLRFDTSIVSDPSGSYASLNYSGAATTLSQYLGFEYCDDATSAPSQTITAINGVAVTTSISGGTVTSINAAFGTTNIAGDTITFTLGGTPTGANKRLRYAYTGTAGNAGGPTTGPRGCLRDNDTSVASLNGNTPYNWCCHFDDASP